jgi:hypothetical protein
MLNSTFEFVRKLNDDWTIHSYCSRCFATVADAKTGLEAKASEDEHQCDPRLLEMVKKYREVSRLVSAARQYFLLIERK